MERLLWTLRGTVTERVDELRGAEIEFPGVITRRVGTEDGRVEVLLVVVVVRDLLVGVVGRAAVVRVVRVVLVELAGRLVRVVLLRVLVDERGVLERVVVVERDVLGRVVGVVLRDVLDRVVEDVGRVAVVVRVVVVFVRPALLREFDEREVPRLDVAGRVAPLVRLVL